MSDTENERRELLALGRSRFILWMRDRASSLYATIESRSSSRCDPRPAFFLVTRFRFRGLTIGRFDPMNDRSAIQSRHILVVEIDRRRFGFPVGVVRELLRVVTIVPLPRSKGSIPIEGIINLRGSIVPVPDLRAILGLPPKPAEPSDHLVVVEFEDRLVAFRVDRAVELAGLSDTDFDPTKLEPIDEGGRFFDVAKLADGLVPLIDVGPIASSCYLANRKPNGSPVAPSDTTASTPIVSNIKTSENILHQGEVAEGETSPLRTAEEFRGRPNGGDP